MIEINLVPDVKQELIRSQRVRTSVVSISIVIGLAAVAVAVLLAVYVFAVQSARDVITKETIKDEYAQLQSVDDLTEMLTVQNQLKMISETHDRKLMSSRLFTILEVIVPSGKNKVTFSKIILDSEKKTVSFEAQTEGGYAALEAFRKTLAATQFEYKIESGSDEGPTTEVVDLASNITDGERSYGEDSSGKKVLRFVLTFTYPDELLSRSSQEMRIVGPERTNATDSVVGIPKSIFSDRASDVEEDN